MIDEKTEAAELLIEVERLRAECLEIEKREAATLAEVNPAHQASARNLLHYLSLRRRDVRRLQPRLGALGLTSLGRTEAHVLSTLEAVIANLRRISGSPDVAPAQSNAVGYHEGIELLQRHTETVLGPSSGRAVRIMVTMPSEAAADYPLVRALVEGGMDVMRINCAHDGPNEWERMVDHLERAQREVGRTCKVLMDLGGPKLRTGSIAAGPQVIKWKPQRDAAGEVTAPARIWLTAEDNPAPAPSESTATLPVPRAWLEHLRSGDKIRFKDERGKPRTLKVVGEMGDGRWAECKSTAYLGTGRKLRSDHGKVRVGQLPPREQSLHLFRGYIVVVTKPDHPGQPAERDASGGVVRPATIPCTLAEVFGDVKPGERIWFDDGRIGGVVKFVNADQMHVEITNAREKGEKLKSDKGINLPDSALQLPSLTTEDIRDLEFVADQADLVGYSFVREASDVHSLQHHLVEAGGPQVGVVLKIETRAAFERLPQLLLAAMRSPSVAVMIARGDLAVEMGYERLAEVQEEILWVCEAAHVPVIWATQVLETLAKEGMPSRAEITDAAMGQRAECVMLNKGPHVLEALELLNDILVRMQGHTNKRSPVLRELRMARDGLMP